MNQINPIHIVALLVVLVFLLFVKLGQAKDALQAAQNSYSETSELVTKINGLKGVYDAKAQTKKALKRILRQPSLVNAHIEQKTTHHNTVLSTNSIDKKALDSLMSKILNGTYNIAQLDIQRVSDEKASVRLEIKW